MSDREWMSAREALGLVGRSNRWDEAANSIVRRAADGIIDTVASRHIWFDVDSNESETNRAEVPVDKKLWRVSGSPVEASHSFWDSGDLTLYGIGGSFEHRGATHKLYGVRFRRNQIYELAGVDPSPPNAAMPLSKGGGQWKEEDWEAFWMEVIAIAADDQLHKTNWKSQRAFRDELLLRLTPDASDTMPDPKPRLSDSSIKPVVRRIWYRFAEPGGQIEVSG